MAPLPPVRRRESYADIGSGDLVFALFHDRVAGDPDALTPAEDTPLAKLTCDAYHTAYTTARADGATVEGARSAGRAAIRKARQSQEDAS